MGRRNSTKRGSPTRKTASRKRSGASAAGRTRGPTGGPGRGTGRGTSRRSGRRIDRRTLVPLALIVLVVAMGWYLYPLLRMNYVEQRRVDRLEQELVSLQERNERLASEVDRLRTPEGVEEVARESLGLVKPGEHPYMVTGGAASEATSAPVDPRQSDPWYVAVLDAVFGVER